MTPLAQSLILLWLPLSLIAFAVVPPRRAVLVVAFAGALFLPNAGYTLSGLPDYNKNSATNLALFLGILIFDLKRLTSFRPRWFDTPMAVWCVCPVISALTNDLGIYSGLSQLAGAVLNYGIVYLAGRIYLNDLDGLREFSLTALVFGLLYLPLCLIESAYGPFLEPSLYGIKLTGDHAPRYGLGYRPVVFLAQGLGAGLWMSNVAIVAYWTWSCGVYKRLFFLPVTVVTGLLIFGAFMTKSVGSWVLFLFGFTVLWLCRRTKSPKPMIALLVIPALYCGLRGTNLWSGDQLIYVSQKCFGFDRAFSLAFRIGCENTLSAKAMQRPLFGWSAEGRNRVTDEFGHDIAITDGYWVITLGTYGLVGLTAMIALYVLPGALLLRKTPVRNWSDPQIAPAAVLSVMVALVMVDFLSNAFPSMIQYLAIGGLMGVPVPASIGRRRGEADAIRADAAGLLATGSVHEAEDAYRHAIAVLADDADPDLEALDAQAAAVEDLADLLLASGRAGEAESCYRDALMLRQEIHAALPEDPIALESLAADLEGLGRSLKAGGGSAGPVGEAWMAAIAVRERLGRSFPDDPSHRTRWADALNDLAWFLITRPGRDLSDAGRAVALAAKAVEVEPGHVSCWNTLGAAHYYAGDWGAAVLALRRSVEYGEGGTGFDFLLLAMAYARLGDHGAAVEGYRRGAEWVQIHNPHHPELLAFLAEASGLLGSGSEV